MSFFPLSVLSSKAPPPSFPLCEKCGMHRRCKSPKMPPSGKNGRDIMIVGEAPGRNEDEEGRAFVGPSGKLLSRLLRRWGVNMREDCVLVNALSCRPPRDFIKDEAAVEWCRPLVLRAIEKYNPTVIIPLGKRAVRSVIGHLWKEDTEGVLRWAGSKIPCRKPNAWICPSIHPSYVLHQLEDRDRYKDGGMSEKYLEGHLRAAVSLAGSRPWKQVPDYSEGLELLHDDRQAEAAVLDFVKKGRPCAFDYETNCLKPQASKARIVCCSVSDGRRSVAFFWRDRAMAAMKKFLASGVPKVAANAKFEDHWSTIAAGVPPNNWFWDTMVQGHTIDNRRGITGLKFQAFTLLGQEDYDGHLKGFLETEKGAESINRIHEVEPNQLLRYCALDALLEWKIAKIQTTRLGVAWPN